VVVAGGTPALTLNDGGTAYYDPAATAALDNPAELVFDYTVGAGDSDTSALAITGIENGSDVEDLAGNIANFSGINFAFDSLEIETAPCYCRGTRIAIERGEVTVEDLAIGDEIVTASGARRPVKWIGRRSYSGRFVLGRADILPVCIRAGALGEEAPRRDLWVSPHHAMLLEGVLIEAKDLINDVSIVQAERIDKVEYFHIELESHDIIFAEGASSETFIDDDSRLMFHNAHDYFARYPDAVTAPARYCAPRLDHGYAVEAARGKIAARAGLMGAGRPLPASQMSRFPDAVQREAMQR